MNLAAVKEMNRKVPRVELCFSLILEAITLLLPSAPSWRI
jgi:hypothetical protein